MTTTLALPKPKLRDLLLIVVFSLLYSTVVLTSKSGFSLLNSDYPWYMNRADLIWRGILDDTFVYTFTYPWLVGAINTLVQNLLLSSLITNTLILVALGSGIYYLGCLLYNRPIALIAVVLIACNPFLIEYMRQMQTMMLFSAVIVWCFIVAIYGARSGKVWWAILLGIGVTIAMYTRFEGVMFGILFVGCGLSIARHHSIQKGILFFVVTIAVLLPFFMFYMSILARGAISSGTDNFIVVAFNQPDLFAYISRSLTLSVNIALSSWSPLLWGLALVALCFFGRDHWQSHANLWGLGLLHGIVLFVLTYYPRHIDYYPPMMCYGALVFAWALYTLGNKLHPSMGAVALSGVLCALPLLSAFPQVIANRSVGMLWDTPYEATSINIDAWLHENNLQTVWTLCPYTIPYTHVETHYIYRFAGSFDPATLPDAPMNLLPKLTDATTVFMHCDLNAVTDWASVLDGSNTYGYTLEPLQQFSTDDQSVVFRFFRIRKL